MAKEITVKSGSTFWLWVVCLTGVDYFSTLGYQPSIAFEASCALAPLATMVIAAMTLFGAFPVYCRVAEASPHGEGSIGMIEQMTRGGWISKLIVLALLGFAFTDFIVTMTLSAADAAAHLVDNPLWPSSATHLVGKDGWIYLLTCLLLFTLGLVFWRGFREAISIAVVLVAVYLVLNLIVVGSSAVYLAGHPNRVAEWGGMSALENGTSIPRGCRLAWGVACSWSF